MSKKRIKILFFLTNDRQNTIFSILIPGGVENEKFISVTKELGKTAAIVFGSFSLKF
jgi:hypothetical protein